METSETLEYRCTIVLPFADNYHVADVLKLISFAIRNRGTCLTQLDNGSELTQENTAPTWDERTTQLMLVLMQRLHRSACSNDFELWSLSADTVKEPPTDLNDIRYWATTSSIYRSDLIRFCEKERVKVRFDREGDSNSENLPSHSLSLLQVKGVADPAKEKSFLSIPGKMPNIGIRKLVVEAAWEIECELRRPASPSEVMQRLRLWTESREGDCLKSTDKKNCIAWETKKGVTKIFDSAACEVALREWRATRA